MTSRAAKTPAAPLTLRLYVAGESPNSNIARANLKDVLAHLGITNAVLEIIDVMRNPARSLTDGILITPTLVRGSRVPEPKIIGNLRDRAALVAFLTVRQGGDG